MFSDKLAVMIFLLWWTSGTLETSLTVTASGKSAVTAAKKLYKQDLDRDKEQGGDEEREEDAQVRERKHRQQMNGNKLSGAILKWDQ